MSSEMNRKIKDSVFCTLFSIPEYTLDMYRALHPEDTEVTEKDIDIITIQNILVSGMYNDLGLQVGNRLMILVEAQSTFTKKLAVRLFLYLAESLEKYITKMKIDLYTQTDIVGYLDTEINDKGEEIRKNPFYKIPTPELYVIYTGDKKNVPDEVDISELYEPMADGTKPLSLKVKIIKSSAENNIIGQYIEFCSRANEMRKKYPDDRKRAVQELVKYCTENNILAEFVKEHEKEVYDMVDVLFNQEYVTDVHEKNLIWQGYDNAAREFQIKMNDTVSEYEVKLDEAVSETNKAAERADKAESELAKYKAMFGEIN